VSNGRINKELTKDELLMCYWIIEAVTMRIDVKKEELDKIIDGKSIPTKEAMAERVKEFL
jgi:3-hydroxyacyl-CoA dehydrogenase